jgi:hypothetical protein
VACTSTCTFSWSASSGSHSFAAEIDDGTKVLAEGIQQYTLNPGANALAPLVMNGVDAEVGGFSNPETLAGGGTQYIGTFSIGDADGNAITNAGGSAAFDNQCPLFASSAPAIGTVAISSACTPTATGAGYPYTVSCVSGQSGTFQIVATNRGGTGDVTPAELAALGITYPSTITGTVYVYTCTAGQISDSGGTVTLQ